MITLQSDILKTLAYFDIFHYPLTNDEIRNFLGTKATQQQVNEQLIQLEVKDIIYKIDGFYSLHNDLFLVVRRKNGNQKAVAEIHNAVKAAKILHRFPFVEGLALSGSLSKNYADENTDIDFFIITKANRLWIARTLMHIFYRFASVAGKQDWFCMNYYIDENGMDIEEKNIFTAIEIVTLIPMQGVEKVADFINKNKWTTGFLPAYTAENKPAAKNKKWFVKAIVEKLLSGSIGNTIDNWLLKKTANRWAKKEQLKNLNAKGICMGMLAGKHFAKPDPKHFQQKILAQYYSKTAALLQEETTVQALAG